MSPLSEALRQNSLSVSEGFPIEVSGQLTAGEFVIDGGISSQFISGLLFSLPRLSGDSRIVIKGAAASAGYIDMTLDALRRFGIEIRETDYGYFAAGGQTYTAPKTVAEAEGDWSGAAFFLAAGALCGDVTVHGLNPVSRQGDRAIEDVLRRMGADIEVHLGAEGIRAAKRPCPLKALEYNAAHTPDLVPIIAVLCGAAQGVSRIYGVERLRLKESDRLAAVIELLTALGVRARYDGGGLTIEGLGAAGRFRGGALNGHDDHRMVMSAAVAACAAEGECVISGAGAVGKSYPRFFEELSALKKV
jgi:3-phosphoshikimate 1-carboxyvinyltransferase